MRCLDWIVLWGLAALLAGPLVGLFLRRCGEGDEADQHENYRAVHERGIADARRRDHRETPAEVPPGIGGRG